MVSQTNAQLRRELATLKRKRAIRTKKLKKLVRAKEEKIRLESEIKDLKRSKIYIKMKSLSKKKPTKAQFEKLGKGTAKAAKSFWDVAGKIVNKLGKIEV